MLRIVSPVHGTFIIQGRLEHRPIADSIKYGVYLPKNFSGAESFQPFEIPSREKIVAVYRALLPAIHFIQEQIQEYKRREGDLRPSLVEDAFFQGVKVRDIVAALERGKMISAPRPNNTAADVLAAEM